MRRPSRTGLAQGRPISNRSAPDWARWSSWRQLDVRLVHAGRDEHPERALGLGEERVEVVGGCQGVSFSVNGPSQVSGDGRPTGCRACTKRRARAP